MTLGMCVSVCDMHIYSVWARWRQIEPTEVDPSPHSSYLSGCVTMMWSGELWYCIRSCTVATHWTTAAMSAVYVVFKCKCRRILNVDEMASSWNTCLLQHSLRNLCMKTLLLWLVTGTDSEWWTDRSAALKSYGKQINNARSMQWRYS